MKAPSSSTARPFMRRPTGERVQRQRGRRFSDEHALRRARQSHLGGGPSFRLLAGVPRSRKRRRRSPMREAGPPRPSRRRLAPPTRMLSPPSRWTSFPRPPRSLKPSRSNHPCPKIAGNSIWASKCLAPRPVPWCENVWLEPSGHRANAGCCGSSPPSSSLASSPVRST